MKKSKIAVAVISEQIFWMLFIAALGITTVVIFSIGTQSILEAAEIPKGIEESILIQIFYNSDKCFTYKDEIGRIQSKVFDLSKFKQDNMEKCFPKSNVKYAFSLLLEAPEINLISGPIKTSNWVGGVSSREVIEDVFVLKDGIKHKAKLKVGIKNVK